MKKLKYAEKGITLISLVITVIILIILAGISIGMLVGENGILTKATKSKQETDQAQKDELSSLASLETQMEETLTSNSIYNEEKKVNSPKLKNNMRLVIFDQKSNTWIEDTTKNAYSYIDTSITGNTNTSEWANAEVTVDGITSYFVWIPRFAYKITYYTDENKTTKSNTPTAYGTIDIKFIKGIKNIATDETICKYANENPDVTQNYIVHPAFTKDANYGGGWDNELSGIWIGKFETSSVEGILNNQEDNITTKKAKIQPGVKSWRNISLGNMYTVSQNYLPELKSHMLKNSEWGAVAYLTDSKYGRNGIEIAQDTSPQYSTGGGEGNTYITATNLSSTGNVYGIYGLSGGSWEYVASYVKDGSFSVAESYFTNNLSDEYSTVYDIDTDAMAYKYGDATYETSNWYTDRAEFAKQQFGPFFIRGGNSYTDNKETGIFYYGDATGSPLGSASFRIALVL